MAMVLDDGIGPFVFRTSDSNDHNGGDIESKNVAPVAKDSIRKTLRDVIRYLRVHQRTLA